MFWLHYRHSTHTHNIANTNVLRAYRTRFISFRFLLFLVLLSVVCAWTSERWVYIVFGMFECYLYWIRIPHKTSFNIIDWFSWIWIRIWSWSAIETNINEITKKKEKLVKNFSQKKSNNTDRQRQCALNEIHWRDIKSPNRKIRERHYLRKVNK